MTRRGSQTRSAGAAFAGAVLACISIGTGCSSRTDAPTATTSTGTSVQSFSIVLEPSSIRVSPGGSGLTIATIRSPGGRGSSYVVGLPNGVSMRSTTASVDGIETTVKYIFFADASVVPGSYTLGVRVIATGGAEREAQLTLVIALDP